jgi:hypothetical protein
VDLCLCSVRNPSEWNFIRVRRSVAGCSNVEARRSSSFRHCCLHQLLYICCWILGDDRNSNLNNSSELDGWYISNNSSELDGWYISIFALLF